MSTRQKWGYGTFAVGLVLAIVFFIAFGASSGSGMKSALLAAAMVCIVAGANGLAVGISDKIATGRTTGLIVGGIGFVALGIAWFANQCSAGDVACTDTKTSLGWAALFSAIAGLASLLPKLFGGSSAPTS
jgi:hypothetical protein